MRVYYTDKMVANSKSYSPSASKPRKVKDDWIKHFGDLIEIVKPPKILRVDFYRAHDKKYVDGVLDCKESNGFGNRSPEVAKSLPFTTGALFAAAKYSIREKKPAAALCSGFHHAGYSSGGGFCTFNGLMVTAIKLLEERKVDRVGILDLDMHYGDGTDNIIKKLGLKNKIAHFTAGEKYTSVEEAEMFLKILPKLIEHNFKSVDVILVQLGADPYVNDPLGGWLTIDQLKERDRIVFETAKKLGKPIAWNLAGGYTKDKSGNIPEVLEIHRNSVLNCITVYEGEKLRNIA